MDLHLHLPKDKSFTYIGSAKVFFDFWFLSTWSASKGLLLQRDAAELICEN